MVIYKTLFFSVWSNIYVQVQGNFCRTPGRVNKSWIAFPCYLIIICVPTREIIIYYVVVLFSKSYEPPITIMIWDLKNILLEGGGGCLVVI